MTPTRPKSDVRKLWPLVNPEGSDPPNVVSSLQSSASKNSETKAQKDTYLSNQWSSESYAWHYC